ncbi:MAG: hypothetical protein RBS39_00170 [Phycisphaerales bacterium]|jgi:hypothetical protein|nr:hypothetical protein [Phycisphaerales bacterium]
MIRRAGSRWSFSVHLIGGFCTLASSTARAQVDDPALDDASVDEVQEQMRSRPRTTEAIPSIAKPAVRPASSLPPDPELARWLSDRGIGVPMGQVLPAGTFLSRRSGVVLRAPTGERIMAFAPHEADDPSLPPMVLLPCSTLMRMDAVTLEGEGMLPTVISGETTVYRGRNYLLPTAFAPLSVNQSPEATAPSTRPATGANPPTDEPADGNPTPAGRATGEIDPDELGADPRVRELMEELALRRGGPRGISATEGGEGAPSQAAGPTPSAQRQTPGLFPEGEFLSRRRARLVRLNASAWGVAFDSSAMPPGRSDAPLTLLPCDTLERLERLAERTERDLVLEISGRVYTYEGANYLLPVLATLLPPDDLRGMP